MVKPIVIAEPAEASAPLKAWVRNYNLETYRACFLDSCRIFHKYNYTKIKEAKERLCWQDDNLSVTAHANACCTAFEVVAAGKRVALNRVLTFHSFLRLFGTNYYLFLFILFYLFLQFPADT